MARGSVLSRIMGILFSSICMGLELDVMILKGRSLNSSFQDVRGACLHQEQDLQSHNFVTCHVKECYILTQFKRWKPGNSLRWKGGQNIKLEDSDHAPVYTSLLEIPSVSQHSTPSLSVRYIPMVGGLQQTMYLC
ncbi:DNA-(apurinic or apyrimidinic site) endonuclease 2-like [Pyrus x bretschneideri]|uniref:DNA-(apurinic or apyrimidinic site) endonuclease 2-like n=1 Tax=Pyrus x bretschneideri TaxID=225117 RepID=UPI00202DF4A4|nr:DNA-(apurinic or apyrimidinic site) endonuclease 2-like [Pyrus x bretschneideri]